MYFSIISYWEPHDCFDCFNRIPSSRYSIFQYTLAERNVFREKQIGLGFVQSYNEALKEAIQNSDGSQRSTRVKQYDIGTIIISDETGQLTQEEV